MAAPSTVVSDDLDVISKRLTPFSPRRGTRERLEALSDEFQERWSNLNDLNRGNRHRCPIHQDSEEVITTGNGRNGAKKYLCKKHHDPQSTGRDTTEFGYSTYTSFEAYKVYQDFLVEALTLLTTCEGTHEGIAKYLNISKHMVELSVQVLLDYLGDKAEENGNGNGNGNEIIRPGGDLVVIYSDFSGTRVSRDSSVIMTRVGENIAYNVCCAMNYLTAWNHIKSLKEKIKLASGTAVVFVTDGEEAWIQPIQAFFPQAVHIRQFHSQNSRGLVFVHILHQGERYTVRFRWDVVLEMGEASHDALRMRQRRKLEESSRSSRSSKRCERCERDSWTELSDDVFVWKGTVKHPRGRRREGATVTGATATSTAIGIATSTEGDDRGHEAGAGAGAEASETKIEGEKEGDKAPDDGSKGGEEGAGDNGAREDDGGDGDGDGGLAPGGDGPQEVFRGRLEEAVKEPVVMFAFSILVQVFGGHFVTTNHAEALFNVKPSLKAHRTVKEGYAFIQILLFLRSTVRMWSRGEIKSFFREKVATMERIRKISVERKGLAHDNGDPEGVVMEACRKGEPVVISYKDGRGRRTSRMIEPREVETDPYSRVRRIKGYCHLRRDERTFLLERVVQAIPVDTELSIISQDNLQPNYG